MGILTVGGGGALPRGRGTVYTFWLHGFRPMSATVPAGLVTVTLSPVNTIRHPCVASLPSDSNGSTS